MAVDRPLVAGRRPVVTRGAVGGQFEPPPPADPIPEAAEEPRPSGHPGRRGERAGVGRAADRQFERRAGADG